MYLSSASLSKLGNLELSQVREEKYEHKEAQYHMDHVLKSKYPVVLNSNSEFISFFPDLMEYFEHYIDLVLVLQVKPIEAS